MPIPFMLIFFYFVLKGMRRRGRGMHGLLQINLILNLCVYGWGGEVMNGLLSFYLLWFCLFRNEEEGEGLAYAQYRKSQRSSIYVWSKKWTENRICLYNLINSIKYCTILVMCRPFINTLLILFSHSSTNCNVKWNLLLLFNFDKKYLSKWKSPVLKSPKYCYVIFK